MEKKVDSNFIQRIFNTNKYVPSQNLLNMPIEDKFVKNNLTSEKFKIVKEHIDKLDYLKFLKTLDSEKFWTDTVNNISYNHRGDSIKNIGIYFKSPLPSVDKTNVFKVDEFIELLTLCTATNIEKNRGLENEYKKYYLSVVKYLKDNECKEI